MLIEPSQAKVVAKIGPAGYLSLRGGYQDKMDDVSDTCDVVDPCPANASEEYYLNHPPVPPMRVSGPDGKTVAYIDTDGNMRLKGRVFEEWTAWSYWDS